MTGPVHVPVMRDRVVALLAPALAEPGAVFVDATVGLGGHSAAVLDSIPTCRLVGLDRDTAALEIAAERLSAWSDRVRRPEGGVVCAHSRSRPQTAQACRPPAAERHAGWRTAHPRSSFRPATSSPTSIAAPQRAHGCEYLSAKRRSPGSRYTCTSYLPAKRLRRSANAASG